MPQLNILTVGKQTNVREFFRRHWIPLGLGLLFLLQFLFVSPHGEFALNDDWVHTEMIKHWAETGQFRFNPYVGPLLYWPLLYGTALVKLYGFSFTLLRVTTLVWLAVLVSMTYFFVAKKTKQKGVAAICALTFWLNPISYNLAFTFMTDIPALALTAASAMSFWLAMNTRRATWLWVGSLAALVGFFTRQTAGLLLPTFGAYLLWLQYKKQSPFKFITWFIPITFTAAVLVTLYAFLHLQNWLPGGIALHAVPPTEFFTHAAWWIWYIFIYIGVIAAPIAIGCLWQKKIWRDWRWLSLASTSAAVAVLIKLSTNTQLPYVLNILNFFGLGPNKDVLNGVLQFQFPGWLWGAVTVVAAICTATLLYAATQKSTAPKYQSWWLWGAIINAAPLLFVESFDRYVLPIAFLLVIFVSFKINWTRTQVIVAAGAVAFISLYSVSQTAFYLRWNEARWQLANQAAQIGAPLNTIDGGYEWNGMHAYWSAATSGLPHGTWTSPWWIRRLFVDNTEDYVVSFSPLHNYTIVTSTRVEGHNPNNQLYLLRKSNGQ